MVRSASPRRQYNGRCLVRRRAIDDGDLERLQGNWNIVSLEMDGQKMSGGGGQIVVQGRSLHQHRDGRCL